VASSYEHGNAILVSVKFWKFLEAPSYWLLKKGSAPEVGFDMRNSR
jgi:hypothetical protein